MLTMNAQAFDDVMKRLRQITPAFILKLVTSREFVRKAQVYLSAEMMDALKLIGAHATENAIIRVRGQAIKGWATWTVNQYGTQMTHSTRYYFRKARRALVLEGAGRSGEDFRRYYKRREATFKGTLGNRKKARADWDAGFTGALPSLAERSAAKGREFEKVWNVRASGKRYSPSSQMLQDTGRLRQGLIHTTVKTETKANEAIITLGPGSQVTYFDHQNKMRPVFVFDNPKDEHALAKYLEGVAQKAIDNKLGRGR